MKKFLTLLLTLTIFFFVSCGEDTKNSTTCDPTCNSWETCNDDYQCELLSNKCNKDSDCDNSTCNTRTHECESNNPITCIIGHEKDSKCAVDTTDIHDMGVTTGSAPNQILLHDNSLFIVNSMDNAIQKIDLTDGPTNKNPFISFTTDSYPYFMTIDYNNVLIVTNLIGNSYSRVKIEMPLMKVTKSFDDESSLKAPEGIATNENNIFIANADYTTDENWVTTYNDGFITIINKSNDVFVKKIATTQKNPQRVFILNNKLYVINSGIIEFNESYIGYPKSDSGIDILDLSDIDAGFTNIKIPFTDGELSGFAGSYTLSKDNKTLYLASGTAPELYAYDIENNTMIRNTDNPIIVDNFDTPSSVMLNLTTVENYLFVTNFNNDTLYVIDTNNDYKVILKANIGEDSETMEGAQGIVYDKNNKQVYIFFGISKKLISIDVHL
jgi:hypothetical protein